MKHIYHTKRKRINMGNHWSPLTNEPIDTSHLTFDERMSLFNENIKSHKHIVFFGGAGVSTASGIPDFRSEDGLYRQHDIQFDNYEPEYLLSRECLYHNPIVFYEFYRQKLDCRHSLPNAAHFKLAEMEAAGKLDCVVTQNIDGLHQKAGSKNVFEIHGTVNKVYCPKCGKEYPSDYLFTNHAVIPKCSCRGQIRPDITLYGEQLPRAFADAVQAIEKADMLIIAGTSLAVYPANTLLSYFTGDMLVLVNRTETDFDTHAQLIFREDITDVFDRITL